MYGDHWSTSDILFIFTVLLVILAFVLVLVVVTRKNCEVEQERANVIRAQLLALLAIAFGVMVFLLQRKELAESVRHFIA
jgi:hypothetical protein